MLTFPLPPSLQGVRFDAPGFAPVEHDVPAARGTVVDFGTVVLEPLSAVRVVLRNVPVEWRGVVNCQLSDSTFRRSARLTNVDASDGVVLGAPSGRRLQLAVQSEDAVPMQFRADVPELLLSPGETKRCEIDVTALRRTTLHVIGPSPELLQGTSVEWWAPFPMLTLGTVQLDRDGRAELRGVDPATLSFKVASAIDEECVLTPVATSSGSELVLEPTAPLAALRLRRGNGTHAPFAVALVPGDGITDARPLHVFRAAKLDGVETVLADVAGVGRLRWPVGAIVWHGDVGELHERPALRSASLTVVAEGEAPEQWYRFRLLLRGPNDETRVLARRDGRFRATDLAPGTWSLRWQISEVAGPVIDAALAIAAGQEHERCTPWPEHATWRGEVANWNEVPLNERFPYVRFGRWRSFAEGAQLQVDGTGGFVLPLPADSSGPGDVVEFRRGAQGCDGRVVEVDAAARRIVIEHPRVRWVELRVVPRFGGAWILCLNDARRREPWAVLRPDTALRVPLPAGTVLHGELLEIESPGDRHQVTALVTVDAATLPRTGPTVTIAPTGGHWCRLRLRKNGGRTTVELLDARGERCHEVLTDESEVRLWVPEGVGGIRVVCEPGAVQTFAATDTEIEVR